MLLVTPYSPAFIHGHAADDIGRHFYEELGKLVDLTVAAPLPANGKIETSKNPSYRLVHLSTPRYSAMRLIGLYPAAARKDWSRRNTRELHKLARGGNFDHVHVEYMQPLEVLPRLARSMSTSLTLHDVGAIISRERVELAAGLRKAYFWVDHLRVSHNESRSVTRATHAFALSETGRRWIDEAGGHGAVLKLGRSLSSHQWSSGQARTGEFVFAGALWREANQATLRWLIGEVIPRLTESRPPIRIRVVGARAPQSLIDLCNGTPGVDFIGEVDSFEAEYMSAAGVLAPTVVSAGVLLKAQKAMECGAPLVVNTLSAEPLGLTDEACLIADSAADFANAMIRLATDPSLAARIGRAGQQQWLTGQTWTESAAEFTRNIQLAKD